MKRRNDRSTRGRLLLALVRYPDADGQLVPERQDGGVVDAPKRQGRRLSLGSLIEELLANWGRLAY